MRSGTRCRPDFAYLHPWSCESGQGANLSRSSASWRGEQQPFSDEEFGFEKLSWLISYKTATFHSNKKLHSIFRGWGRESERLAVCCDDRERENILTLGRPQQHAAKAARVSRSHPLCLCAFFTSGPFSIWLASGEDRLQQNFPCCNSGIRLSLVWLATGCPELLTRLGISRNRDLVHWQVK